MRTRDFGRMRHRLTIEAPVDAPDGAGGLVRSYVAGDTVFASIQPLAAHREMDAGGERGVGTHRIVIRHRTDLTAQHRLTDGVRVFRVTGIVDSAAERRFLELAAEEVGP